MGAIGIFVKLPIIDHLIINEEKFYSFADSGLLKQIMDNSYYDLSFSQVDKLKEQRAINERKAEQRLAAAEMRIRKEKDVEFAKKLLKKGLSISEIAELTGLEKKEVEKLKK
ncbi:hypothetical protein WSM22_37780 [Cytophagales bacterium WSM2-2]|nr:hypothetical protein WSM22_37780 [Cytophagales bacterium WSM2-2]